MNLSHIEVCAGQRSGCATSGRSTSINHCRPEEQTPLIHTLGLVVGCFLPVVFLPYNCLMLASRRMLSRGWSHGQRPIGYGQTPRGQQSGAVDSGRQSIKRHTLLLTPKGDSLSRCIVPVDHSTTQSSASQPILGRLEPDRQIVHTKSTPLTRNCVCDLIGTRLLDTAVASGYNLGTVHLWCLTCFGRCSYQNILKVFSEVNAFYSQPSLVRP